MPTIVALLAVAPARAQFPRWSTFPLHYPDARVLAPGVLRLGFLPSYAHYDMRYAPDGSVQALGADLNADTVGSDIFPTVGPAEQAVRTILNDSTYRMNMSLSIPLDADVRRFPFDAALGITDRLTVYARVPLVKTRVQGVARIDSMTVNVGLNQVSQAAGNSGALSQVTTLFGELDAATASLQAQIGAGCPGAPSCASAMAALEQALGLRAALAMLSGVQTGSALAPDLPPVAPLAASPAAAGITAQLDALSAQLSALGAGSITVMFPFPTQRLTVAQMQSIVTDSEFGYQMLALDTARVSRLGDSDVGLRVGVLRDEHKRLLLRAAVRLPTGTRQDPLHAFDLGTGDRTLALETGLEFALESKRLAFSGIALYTHHLSDQVMLRWTPITQPIATAAYQVSVDRALGDVVQAAVFPALRLNEAFRVYAGGYYFHKSEDAYTITGPVPGTVTLMPSISAGTGGSSASAVGGVLYRSDRHRDGTPALPVEAGVSYQMSFSGSDGYLPKSTVLNLYLRMYYRLFGKAGG